MTATPVVPSSDGAVVALPATGEVAPAALDSLPGLVAAWLLGYSSVHTRLCPRRFL